MLRRRLRYPWSQNLGIMEVPWVARVDQQRKAMLWDVTGLRIQVPHVKFYLGHVILYPNHTSFCKIVSGPKVLSADHQLSLLPASRSTKFLLRFLLWKAVQLQILAYVIGEVWR
jgi:hypothetical protein